MTKYMPGLLALGFLWIATAAAQPPAGGDKDKNQQADRQTNWEESVKLEAQGDLEGALSCMDWYLKKGGDPYLGALRSGWLHYLKHDYDNSVQSYQKARKANAKAISPILGAANSLLAAKQVDAASRMYGEVLKKDPNHYAASMALAGIYWDRKDYSYAGVLFLRMEGLYPEDAAASSGLAWCQYMQGNKQAAAHLFLRVLTLDSKFPHAAEGYKLCTGG